MKGAIPLSSTTILPTAGSLASLAGTSRATDECVAISTTSDATGTYNRYAFHLGTDYFDYPKLGVWPDGYYMAAIVLVSTDP